MGFFDLFKKKSEKLTEEQVDEIEEKVEETQEKHVKDKAILSDLKKPANVVKKPVVKKAKKPIRKVRKSKPIKKSSEKSEKQ